MQKALKGTQDILPREIRTWNAIESLSRERFSIYGYKEIRTPLIEEAGLFIRGVGEETDIVKKQMYHFKDQGERDICLRPEATASVVRAYIEQHIDRSEGFIKLFYIGPMFRSERPQAGRLRQFHQIGVEAIGAYSPYVDAEVMILLDDLFKGYGLSRYTFIINSLGCDRDKENLRGLLRGSLKAGHSEFCDDCQRRYRTNILRVMDCKNPECQKIIRSLPSILEGGALCNGCKKEFDEVKMILETAGIRYIVSPLLVRGLDYYTKLVFEVTAEGLGAQNAIAAGGRYDNLVEDLGGPKAGACGFAIGMERVIELLSKVANEEPPDKAKLIFVAAIGEKVYKKAFDIMNQLRREGLPSDMDYQQRSLKAQMRYADKVHARYVVLLGEDELSKDIVVLKDMSGGAQETVAIGDLVGVLKKKG